MKHPSSLKKVALSALVRQIQEALYVEDGATNPDKEWNADTLDEIRDALVTHGLVPADKDEKKKLFAVYVHDRRDMKYIVGARDKDEARALVEASDSADVDFGSKTIDSEWYVDRVEEA